MSKFCKNCGSEMNDQEVFCANCGAENEVVADENKDVVATVKEKLSPKTIGIVAVVLALLIVLIAIFGGNGWKKALDNKFDVSYKGKASKIKSLAPNQYWEWLEDETGDSFSELKKEYKEEWKDAKDDIKDEWGSNLRYSFKKEDKKVLSKKKTEKIAEALEDKYDIKARSVKKVIEVEGELTIKGSKKKDTNDTTLTFAKVGGKWYPIYYYEFSGNVYAGFSVN